MLHVCQKRASSIQEACSWLQKNVRTDLESIHVKFCRSVQQLQPNIVIALCLSRVSIYASLQGNNVVSKKYGTTNRMPTAIYDSSLLTQKRNQQAISAFKSAIATAAESNIYLNNRLKGGVNGDPSQEVVLNNKLGCSVCNAAANGYNTMGNTRPTCGCNSSR